MSLNSLQNVVLQENSNNIIIANSSNRSAIYSEFESESQMGDDSDIPEIIVNFNQMSEKDDNKLIFKPNDILPSKNLSMQILSG